MTATYKLITLLILLYPCSGVLFAQEITVGKNEAIHSIQEALNRVTAGSTIHIKKGIYSEPTLIIDKRVKIIGEDGVILDGVGKDYIILIKADSVEVSGLTFQHVETSFVVDRAAIKVDDAHACTLQNNTFKEVFFGIYLAKASHCKVLNNTIHGTEETESRSGNGIHLWYCKNITIKNNRVFKQRDGIYLEFVEDSIVEQNTSEYNKRYGLHFMFSNRCAYRENVFRYNDAGVAVMYTDGVEMVRNTFEQNWGSASYGLLLKDIRDSYIAQNVFKKNTVGVYAEGTSRTKIEQNDFVENGWAVKIMANAIDNTFFQNNFLRNSFDVSTNSRTANSTFLENYWDHYEGYDLDRDGFGDVPFRPVRLFSLLVEQNEPTLILSRSFFVSLLDLAERIFPVLTPEMLIDPKPQMRRRG